MKKSVLSAAGLAVAAALVMAPAMGALADDAPVDEAAPVTEPVEEAPAVEEATPAEEPQEAPQSSAPVEEAPAPAVDAPAAPAPAPVVAETVKPVEVTPQTKTLRWTLPNGGTPENVTWDQPVFNPASIPCGTTVWVQVDTYPYTTAEDQARTDALDDDGLLRNGEDHGWAQSWTFEQYKAPSCVIAPIEIPYPKLLANEVCGADNDTVYVDPAWLTQYGSLVAGPWIDTKYKTIDGKRVVDGSAQIKAEFRKTHIWAGTGSTTASDFRRWMMYPGTAPFSHADVATDCPVIEEPPTEEPPVVEPPVVEPPVEEPVVAAVTARSVPVEVEADTLAQTGGAGAAPFTIGGLALTLAGLALAAFRRHRQEV